MRKNKHCIEGVNPEHKSLSILFNTDGFSFSIANNKTSEVYLLTKYLFDQPIYTPELLLAEVLRIFANEIDLQQDFDKILIIHQNRLSSLVPEIYFQEDNLKQYLDYNVKTLPNDYITYDNIELIKSKNIYIPYVNINNYLFQNFGEFEFKHHSTVLIEKLLKKVSSNDNNFFVYVSKDSIDIIVINNKKLILYNSFEFYSAEDFIYYILFTAEQLNYNNEELKLNLLGDINENDVNYQITEKYIKNIEFITIDSTLFDNTDKFTNHANYILVS